MKSTTASSLVSIALVTMFLIPLTATAQRQGATGQSAGALLAQAATDTASEVPEIFFPETTHDFGVAGQHEKLTHVFIVRNVGDAPLKIIDAHGS